MKFLLLLVIKFSEKSKQNEDKIKAVNKSYTITQFNENKQAKIHENEEKIGKNLI